VVSEIADVRRSPARPFERAGPSGYLLVADVWHPHSQLLSPHLQALFWQPQEQDSHPQPQPLTFWVPLIEFFELDIVGSSF